MKKPSDIDALFALPLADFTAARNALAARMKKEGRADEAQRVKALAKPSATAWAVNQLYWSHRRDFDRLLSVNEKVRQAQIGRAADLRQLLDERRKTISALVSLAADLLSAEGHAASIEARRRITTTLESLVARDRSSIEVEAGRLTADLEPLGFDSLAELLEGAPRAKAKVLDFQQPAKEKLAREKEDKAKQQADAERAARERAEALKQAETTLASARRDAARAEAAAAKAIARRDALEQERKQLEARLAAAMDDARAAENDVRKTAHAVTAAELAVARARSKQ